MNALTKWLAVMVLVLTVGGHWAVLQGIAWTSMLTRFSQTMPLHQALSYTFDGQHPCKICLAVKKGQQAEHQKSKLKPPEKLILFLDVQIEARIQLVPVLLATRYSENFASRSAKPPHPPPLFVSVIS